MIDPRFVFLGALLSLAGSTRYAWLTWRGRTQPNRVTWFLWALAPAVGFAAQVDEGVGLPAVLTASIALGPALIFAASWTNAGAYWRVRRADLACGAVSLVALWLWLALDQPVAAVMAAVVADLVAGLPTVWKAWVFPETEHWAVYALGGGNGVIALLSLERWTVAGAAFPLYIAVLGTGVALVVTLRAPAGRLVGG
ncbi:hypothetical protein KLP28_16795 [Nocardioidaceae bacterium]|nr:hypothetical protein KLP28_16795 [Nocardioidaceae bacterium]